MEASLDTDIVIHLYKSGKEELLFSFFDKLYMHEYLLENELRLKSISIYEKFLLDVESGKIIIIRNKDLADMGVKCLFDEFKTDYNYLFHNGELHGVALAKAMGIAAFVSDDTNDFGPHETLVKELIEDVIPFAFYELLFLKYLTNEISLEEMYDYFEDVNTNSMNQHPMNFKKKMLSIVKRFTKKHGTTRDIDWIDNFCSIRKIDFNNKMIQLRNFLKSL